MSEHRDTQRMERAIADLVEHATDSGRPLPADASGIALAEEMWGAVVDLGSGDLHLNVATDDGVRTLDESNWLASLEEACEGKVTVAWAMRPEVYFAQVAGGNHADLQPE